MATMTDRKKRISWRVHTVVGVLLFLLFGHSIVYSAVCNNGICEFGEDTSVCSSDCKYVLPYSEPIMLSRSGGGPRGVITDKGEVIVGVVTYTEQEAVMQAIVYDQKTLQQKRSVTILKRPVKQGWNLGNPTPFIMKSGRIIMGFRDHKTDGAAPTYRLRIVYSDDGGDTWNFFSEDSGIIAQGSKGLWEPFFYYDKNGNLRVVYAKELRNETCLSQTGNKQDIVMKYTPDDGKTWVGETVIATEGTSRDGVPTVARLQDGSYIMVFESWRDSSCGRSIPKLVIRSVQSQDGITWTKRRLIYASRSSGGGSRPSAYPRASWPTVVKMTDERLLLAFTTDEDFPNENGQFLKDNKANLRMMTSKGQPSFDNLSWDEHSIIVYPDRSRGSDVKYPSLISPRNAKQILLLYGAPPRLLKLNFSNKKDIQ